MWLCVFLHGIVMENATFVHLDKAFAIRQRHFVSKVAMFVSEELNKLKKYILLIPKFPKERKISSV